MSEPVPDSCPNCGAPLADGWVIHVKPPKEGALLTDDHTCPDCGTGFWHDDNHKEELDSS